MNKVISYLAIAVTLCSGCGGGERGAGGGGSFDMGAFAPLIVLAGVGAIAAMNSNDTLPPSTSDGPVEPTRLFASFSDLNPSKFATFGIVAFPTSPNSSDANRFRMFCEAYSTGLNWVDGGSAPASRQAVTVWPLTDKITYDRFTTTIEDGCNRALADYDVRIARQAIEAANARGAEFSGQGPFFIAWSLGETFLDNKEGQILAYDMSQVTDARQATTHVQQWSREISAGPDTWDGDWKGERRWIAIQRTFTNLGRPIDEILFESSQ